MIEAFRVGAVSRGKTLWEGLHLALGDGELPVVAGAPPAGQTLPLKHLRRGARRGKKAADGGIACVGGSSRDGRGGGFLPVGVGAGEGRARGGTFPEPET